MNQDHIAVIHECVTRSLRGEITFPQVVGKLAAIGVERYHADYTRQENTFYFPDGQTHVEPAPHTATPTAETFSRAGVEAAIRQIQRGQIVYAEFVRQTIAAGCVGYFVLIAGRQAQYFGRKGEVHVEPFPAAKA